jgi:Flp pilus assembly protein TadD
VERQAALLLQKAGFAGEIPSGLKDVDGFASRNWRQRINIYPRDAIGWMELALVQTSHGSIKHAKRSVKIALQLAPNNRHVLRSASRFHLHRNDPEFAHDILSKAEATKNDPWLIASEIAMARLAERKSRFYKRGLAILEDEQRVPREITELAGSIATNEMIEGNRKKARRFFGQSMSDPNGNALAQAEWASPVFGTKLLEDFQLRNVAEPFEARALHEYREGRFENVIAECMSWAESEQYSIRPLETAASAAAIIERHSEAVDLAERGLRLRPKGATLLNSRAYSLASLGQLEEAEKSLAQISDSDITCQLINRANQGFITLCRKQKERGISEYLAAIDGFKAAKQPHMALYATTYLARALAHTGYFLDAEILQNEIQKAVEGSGQQSTKHVFRSTELRLAAHKHRHGAQPVQL